MSDSPPVPLTELRSSSPADMLACAISPPLSVLQTWGSQNVLPIVDVNGQISEEGRSKSDNSSCGIDEALDRLLEHKKNDISDRILLHSEDQDKDREKAKNSVNGKSGENPNPSEGSATTDTRREGEYIKMTEENLDLNTCDDGLDLKVKVVDDEKIIIEEGAYGNCDTRNKEKSKDNSIKALDKFENETYSGSETLVARNNGVVTEAENIEKLKQANEGKTVECDMNMEFDDSQESCVINRKSFKDDSDFSNNVLNSKAENPKLRQTDQINYARPWLSVSFDCNSGNSKKEFPSDTVSKDTSELKLCDRPDVLKSRCFNPELEKAVHHSKENLMKFAEILYKCTLCTSIPSILTSKESFIRHVNEHHLTKDTHFQSCHLCALKFRTEEDLKEHVMCLHEQNESDVTRSHDQTGNDITNESHDQSSNNDSDSDSSGHRQLRTKSVKRSKPKHDFENPKQLVDHTGIETLDGSLDLSRKCSEELTKKDANHRAKDVQRKEVNDINIKQITEQIIKSDVQCRNQNESIGNKLPFVPSYTPDFGKYTKLVREGGNIVYFCQICNWKSPIKTTFQVHCNMSSHKNKVNNAENPDSSEKSTLESRSSRSSSDRMDTTSHSPRQGKDSSHSPKSTWAAQDMTFGPKFPDASLFYNYIVRGTAPNRGRTPVVSPYSGRGSGVFENVSRFSQKRSSDHPMDLAMKKRKRTQRYVHSGVRLAESESDDDQTSSSTRELYKMSPSMAILRNKLLESAIRNENRTDVKHSGASSYNMEVSAHKAIDNGRKVDNTDSVDLINVKKEHGDSSTNGSRSSPVIGSSSGGTGASTGGTGLKFGSDHLKLQCSESSVKLKNKCHACPFAYSKIEDYERHFDKVHKSMLGNILQTKSTSDRLPSSTGSGLWPRVGAGDQLWAESGSELWENKMLGTNQDGKADKGSNRSSDSLEGGNCEMGENWRVQKMKELLPDYVIECEKGNTSRDNLLQCISTSTEFTDAVLWSSACNRAVRELFPNSQAQRKGKYKKTFYFGISMLESYQVLEESLLTVDGDTSLSQLPPRDISMDMERIVEQLPGLLKWTGCMELGVYRHELLVALSAVLHEPEAVNWGAQCNRAIRLVFPHIDMKRKGKFKTMYLGVEFHKSAQRLLSQQTGLELFRAQHSVYSRNSPPLPPLTEQHSLPEEFKRGTTLTNMFLKRANSPTFSPQSGASNSPTNLSLKGNNSGNVSDGLDNERKTNINSPEGHNDITVGTDNKRNELDLKISASIREDAQKEMEEYLLKFGGVPSLDSACSNKQQSGDDDDDNDGDDEGGSIDSGTLDV